MSFCGIEITTIQPPDLVEEFCKNSCGGACCQLNSTAIQTVEIHKREGEWILNEAREAIIKSLEEAIGVDVKIRLASINYNSDEFKLAFKEAQKNDQDLTYRNYIKNQAKLDSGMKLVDIYFEIVKKRHDYVKVLIYALMSCSHFDEEERGCGIQEKKAEYCKDYYCKSVQKQKICKDMTDQTEVQNNIEDTSYQKTTDVKFSIEKLKRMLK